MAARGNALVLAVLLLLALSSAGLMAVQRTAQDLTVAGNVTEGVKAWLVSQSGLAIGTADFGKNVGRYTQEIKSLRTNENASGFSLCRDTFLDVNHSVKVNPNRQGCQFSKISSTDTVDKLLPCVNPSCATTGLARARQAVAYQVENDFSQQVRGAPGNDVNSDTCNFIFDLTSRAGIPRSTTEAADRTLNPEMTTSIITDYRTRVIAGPAQCLGK